LFIPETVTVRNIDLFPPCLLRYVSKETGVYELLEQYSFNLVHLYEFKKEGLPFFESVYVRLPESTGLAVMTMFLLRGFLGNWPKFVSFVGDGAVLYESHGYRFFTDWPVRDFNTYDEVGCLLNTIGSRMSRKLRESIFQGVGKPEFLNKEKFRSYPCPEINDNVSPFRIIEEVYNYLYSIPIYANYYPDHFLYLPDEHLEFFVTMMILLYCGWGTPYIIFPFEEKIFYVSRDTLEKIFRHGLFLADRVLETRRSDNMRKIHYSK
jgi:hypothetical protein